MNSYSTVRLKSPRKIPRVAVLSPASPTGERGGAERLYDGLVNALNQKDVVAEHVSLLMDESDFHRILDGYLRFYDIDLCDFDGVISTKAPSYMVRHRNHVCFLPHTIRVFYDMFTGQTSLTSQFKQARIVWNLDRAALTPPHLKRLFCVGGEVKHRLGRFLDIDANVLHHPSTLETTPADAGRYFFLPGRLHPWKRVDMAINAIREMQNAYPLVISGTGEDEGRLRDLAANLPQVTFVGNVDEAELAALYSNALAVIFCPIREDYGLVGFEAFSSGKPVVTCTDSGEPARFVNHGYNGLVCAPDPVTMARNLDYLVERPEVARKMGRKALEAAARINWDSVTSALLDALDLGGDRRMPC